MNNSETPAVPVMDESDHGQHYGLTKREHFAGLAMQGLLAKDGNNYEPRDYAKFAIKCADALLEEITK